MMVSSIAGVGKRTKFELTKSIPMNRMKLLISSAALCILAVGAFSVYGGNGNGPQSGSGGNAANNGGGNNIWIYHTHGNGTWSLMEISQGAMAGHAAHGDVWYQTGCPLSGGVTACQ
jgi:hypothetical protein